MLQPFSQAKLNQVDRGRKEFIPIHIRTFYTPASLFTCTHVCTAPSKHDRTLFDMHGPVPIHIRGCNQKAT